MSSLFYRNARLLVLSIVLILVWGLSSFFTLPRLEDPELTSRNAIVKTFLPGADAERIEALVTEKIEDRLSEIEEIETYESASRAGSSIIQIELFDRIKGDRVDNIWSRVRDKLDEAASELPPGTTDPELEEFEVKAYASIAALTWNRDDPPNYAILRRLAESLKDEIEGLNGTEKVEIFGDPSEEITVEIEPSALTSIDLTASAVSQQIFQSDAKLSAGQFRSDRSDLSIEVESELNSIERVRNIPIRFGNDGQFVRLGDMASISKGIAQPPTELAVTSGRPAIVLASFVESNYRIDRWGKAVEKTFDRFQNQLPSDLEIQVIFNQSNYVETRLQSLIFNLLLGAGLVFGVTFFVMGWQSAIVVGIALPLSSCMVLGWMQILGIPLHQMSITGLIVALGLLIDTAIVVVDEVNHHLNAGAPPKAAISQSIQHLSAPLLGSTITTILAFVPIVLMPGGPGEFVGTIAIGVILAVSSSLFLSLTVLPALTVWMRRSTIENRHTNPRSNTSNAWWNVGYSHPWLTQLYRRSLRRTLARPALGILLSMSLPVAGFVGAATLTEQFFPPTDRDQLQIEIELPASASLQQTQYAVDRVRTLMVADPGVTDVHWFLGRSAPRFYYNLTGGREQYANYAQGLVQLSDRVSLDLVRSLQSQLDRAFPEARSIVRQLEQGPPFDAPVELRIYGSDLERLQILGEQARSILTNIPQVTHTRDSLSEVIPQLTLQIDEEEARLAGLDNAAISRQLDATLEGQVGGSILEEMEELPVRVRVGDLDRGNLEQVTSLGLLPTAETRDRNLPGSIDTVPLSALGELALQPELSTITRRNGRRFNLIQAYISAGVLPAEVLGQFRSKLAASDFVLPAGYSTEIGGEAEERDSALGGMFSSVGVLGVLMVATLVLSLRSFRMAALIGAVGVGSIGLGLFSLWLFGYPFGFMGIVGTFGLVGVAVNDSVVVLVALREDSEARVGNRRAIREVVIRSSRHVVATTLTTAIGFVPLVLEGGGFWPPLAVAISGGIVGATLLALYFVPCAYLSIVRRSPQTVALLTPA
ncbi:MAG: efflux RND transporter permease subunit [Cyanobacteria bacterium SBC]|nr:efflux RND transporter permease subunit [Cyanobacteria bacterium SBC]